MTESSTRTRVLIHLDVTPGIAGGTAQSTQGLIRSLGRLEGPEEYVFAAQCREQEEWASQYLGPNQKIVGRYSAPGWKRPWNQGLEKSIAGRARAAVKPLVDQLRWLGGRLMPQEPRVERSDGYYESLGCDVLHFPTQPYFICSLPTIYNPHDLQHLHYPQFWPPEELARREVVYRAACHFSQTVVVGSEWIKRDVVFQYGLHPDKVQIIPWAPPTDQYPPVSPEQLAGAEKRLGLPRPYAFYPAVTWPHKNHIRLFEAMAQLRDRHGVVLNLVCTGSKYESFWPKIQQRIKELKLQSQVRFMGFVSEEDLRAIYRLSQFLVLPTLFEADSCPVHEAWSEGVPVASSNLTAMPDQVGDAGLLFNALNVDAITDALLQMSTSPSLREDLVQKGHSRVKDFDWSRTAKAFRAVYRRAANATLTEEDRWLLQWDWMREPGRTPPAPGTYPGT